MEELGVTPPPGEGAIDGEGSGTSSEDLVAGCIIRSDGAIVVVNIINTIDSRNISRKTFSSIR